MNEEEIPKMVLKINVKLNAQEEDWSQNEQQVRKYVTQKEKHGKKFRRNNVWEYMDRDACLSSDPHKAETF
jgi:hypothetical protein